LARLADGEGEVKEQSPPPKLMTRDEVKAWAAYFKDARKKGGDMGMDITIKAWKVEAMVHTLSHLMGKEAPQLGEGGEVNVSAL
jgi:hypothetical protein